MRQAENNLKTWLPPIIRMNGFTISDFCHKMGIHRSLYYQYLEDSLRPSTATALKMADVLQCSPKEVLEQVRPRRRFWGTKVF